MIPARHSRAFARLFAAYTARLLGRHFHAVWVRGSLPDTLAPLVVAAQHVAWWDPMLLFHLSRTRFGGTHFVMMEEANLRRLPFFGRIGAFGIDRSSRAETLAALRYALARLGEPGSRVWVFPQGELAPPDRRPIACGRGAAWLAARSRAPVVPVALRYEFREAQRPEAFVSFGTASLVASDRAEDGGDPVELLLTREADRLRDDVYAGRLDGFDCILAGRRSIADRYAER